MRRVPSLAARLYGRAVRLLAPELFRAHGEDAAATAARLARDARARGRGSLVSYWFTEYRSLIDTAWRRRAERRSREAPRARRLPMLVTILQDVRYAIR